MDERAEPASREEPHLIRCRFCCIIVKQNTICTLKIGDICEALGASSMHLNVFIRT